MNLKGTLIDDEEARSLSQKLYRLGDQVSDICDELDQAGYGDPVRVIQRQLETLAGTKEGVQRLWLYWSEYAKERLAGLVGPMDILKGKLPSIAAYRSAMLADLRAHASDLPSHSPIVSPQIEPTIKRSIEMLPDDPLKIRINDAVKQARKTATRKLLLPELEEFTRLSEKAQYELLIDRYKTNLLADGFTLDSHRKTGVVFRRLTSDGRWAFVFVDQSWDAVGMLSIQFGLTLPKKAVLPSFLPATAVATFSANDIVPRFGAACGFAPSSYAEFCLAGDACACLARILYRRIDALLCS
jgi:hypothetical protein